jgi:hypothetical protein
VGRGRPHIRAVTAGGRDGVYALVSGAPRASQGKAVVGLVDSDFSLDNQASWKAPDVHILRVPAHEFENLLLDFDVLSAVARTDAAADIEEAGRKYAGKHKWWMACKKALDELRGAVSAYFPADPALSAMSQQQAASHITRSDYWKQHKQALATWDSSTYVERRIAEIGADYDRDLANGDWKRNFSGKEVFRHVRTFMPGLCRYAKGKTPADNDETMGVLFARELRKPAFTNTSPTAKVLHDLRAALRHRAGLPP